VLPHEPGGWDAGGSIAIASPLISLTDIHLISKSAQLSNLNVAKVVAVTLYTYKVLSALIEVVRG
jgi:hypothetical protein